jgi:hypothetical protein
MCRTPHTVYDPADLCAGCQRKSALVLAEAVNRIDGDSERWRHLGDGGRMARAL